MVQIDKLLERFCPQGVEFVELKDILMIKNGSDYKNYDVGDIPVYGSGGIIAYIDRCAFDKPSVLIPRKGSIDKLYYVETPFWNVDTIFYTDTNLEKAIPKYVFYCLQKEHLEQYNNAGGVPSLTQSILNRVKIPVPPLPVQAEIVRILDNFTELTAELNEKLAAELLTRKKQYEYYKNQIFLKYTDKAQFVVLNSIADVRDGTHDSPKPSNIGRYLITSKNVKNGTINFDGAYLISENDYNAINSRSKVDKWDLLFTMIGTVGEVGLVYEEPDYAIKNVGLIKTGDELLSRFLKHYLTSNAVKTHVENNRSKGSQVFLALGKLRNLPIPSLTKSQQEQIVSILDRLDKLCNDLSEGLPAEIAARQKQYEYYRDKLLTFKIEK